MTRTIQDQDLLLWEAYATAGDFGYPDHSKIVFHCLSNPGRRARILEREGDKSDVEQELVRMSESELEELFDRTKELS
jgi:hypothetical protein